MTRKNEKKLERELEKARKKKENDEKELQQRQQVAMRRVNKIEQALISLQFTVNALADYWANIREEYIQQFSGK